MNERRGIVRASVTTAVSLSDAETGQLTQRLESMTGRKVLIEADEDPSIIGGIRVRIGDKLIDGSVRTRLLALKRRMEGAQA